MSLFRIQSWQPGDPAPDLWDLLSKAICKKPGDRAKRIPIADSKALKLPNDSTTRHPLLHLERGALAFLRSLASPGNDHDLFAYLGAAPDDRPWYASLPTDLPIANSPGDLAIAASCIAAAMETAGVELLDMRCLMVPESTFNQVVRDTGTKAEATALALGHHLRRIVAAATDPARTDPAPCLRIVCDQLGGRTQYEGLLARELSCSVAPLAESGERSRYQIAPDSIVQFMPEAESAHLPVALASMVAKFVRELAMMRFNRYWCGRCPELKPTAGYSTDARRWLTDMAQVLAPEERAAMVRIA
jgi:hypothetical protein